MPKRLAVISSIYTYLSHTQHFAGPVPRGLSPIRPLATAGRRGRVALRRSAARRRPEHRPLPRVSVFEVYPSIAEALRCGGDSLAVDGVLIICEHGDYPNNEKGQKLYPRYEMFKACADVFEQDGRSVPVYNDKNLSYSFEKGLEMVADSKRLDFPVLAGSSLPVTWRLPDLELPLECDIEAALMVGVGGSDAMDYHALEAMQCMIERRRGGETGVRSVQMIVGDDVWKAGEQGRYAEELLESALSRCGQSQGF